MTNELTIYVILCQNVTIFYRQELGSLFQVQEQWKCAGIHTETFRVAFQMTVMLKLDD